MRSTGFTAVLAIAAVLAVSFAWWHLRDGSFDALFGAPPTPVGERLYSSFQADEVKHIRITSDGVSAAFSLGTDGWQASTPWSDRMDPRAAVSIINFTLGMRVEDSAGTDKIDHQQARLHEKTVTIRLEDSARLPLAQYRLGRVAPWKAEVEEIEGPVPTVFIYPRDQNRGKYIYCCTGDINPLFKDGLRFLRDHRPFYFNPVNLKTIRIRSQEGDLMLGREDPGSPWRIVKPLDLPTDPAAIRILLEGLFELQAVNVSDRAAVTLPDAGEAPQTRQIAIQSFQSETETILEIHPPETPEATAVPGTVSDRPGTVFDLPLKADAGLVALASLPLSVNDLRDPRLTHLQVASLRGIAIIPSTGAQITISRQPPQPWRVESAGISGEANEENLFSLLKAVTTTKAIGFESDAATDFSPWGLDRPILRLRFLGQSNQGLELNFGIDGEGGYFVNRLGTPTVMRVDPSLVAAIAVRPYEWRHSRLWSLDRSQLVAIKLTKGESQPLILKYDDGFESWQAEQNGKNLDASLNPAHANFLLSVLEALKVSRWLAQDDAAALAALEGPTFAITVTEFTVNEDFERTGVIDRSITLAPGGPGNNPGFYYGLLDGDKHPFLIDAETYAQLDGELFDP